MTGGTGGDGLCHYPGCSNKDTTGKGYCGRHIHIVERERDEKRNKHIKQKLNIEQIILAIQLINKTELENFETAVSSFRDFLLQEQRKHVSYISDHIDKYKNVIRQFTELYGEDVRNEQADFLIDYTKSIEPPRTKVDVTNERRALAIFPMQINPIITEKFYSALRDGLTSISNKQLEMANSSLGPNSLVSPNILPITY
jgi:hypothetical protein